jgi:hypothetical protein
MLIWLNFSRLKLWRRVSLTRLIIVPTIDSRSSALMSVNMTPTTECSLYQPVTSVSRVDSDKAARMRASTFPVLSEGRQFPASRSISRKGCPERSVRFLSSAIMR